MRHLVFAAAFLMLVVLASGCTKPLAGMNETTEYQYYNVTVSVSNESGNASGNGKNAINDFMFKLYGDGEFWLKANDTIAFDVVFNNADDDGESHMYIARAFPSAADFDVMAAFQCLHFTTCDPLLSRMQMMFDQPENLTFVNYAYVGLSSITIRIPDATPSGTYMFNMIACKDVPFANCNQTTTNFGANVPIVVHVL
jgi:hypothetical protein